MQVVASIACTVTTLFAWCRDGALEKKTCKERSKHCGKDDPSLSVKPLTQTRLHHGGYSCHESTPVLYHDPSNHFLCYVVVAATWHQRIACNYLEEVTCCHFSIMQAVSVQLSRGIRVHQINTKSGQVMM